MALKLAMNPITGQFDLVQNLSGYAKLDQTQPQTFINGIPLLNAVNGEFNNPLQIVNKQYIDKRVRGGGGFIANVYFRTDDSDVSGYKRIDYLSETIETELSGTINSDDGEVLLRTYLYDGVLDTTLIDAGIYTANYRVKVSSHVGNTQLGFEAFLRDASGNETTLFRSWSIEIDDTDYVTLRNESNQPSFVCNSTDRFGVRIYARTTHPSNITINTIVGGEHASYFSTPLALRHSLLRGRDAADQHPISAITDLTSTLNNKADKTDLVKARIQFDGLNNFISTISRRGRTKSAKTMTAWEMTADVSGSASVTIKKATYANLPSTLTTIGTITLTTAQKATGSLSVALSAGDYLIFELTSCSGLTELLVELF